MRTLLAGTLAALAVLSPAARADTIIAGGNIVNQTWTTAGSPYIVQGDITIPTGSTLTIQAGVIVEFAAGDSSGSGHDTTQCEVNVNGTLNVQGSAASPVTIRGHNGAAWFGLILAASSSVNVAHASLANAVQPIWSDCPNLQLSALAVAGGTCLVSSGAATITDSTFTASPIMLAGGSLSLGRVIASSAVQQILIYGGSATIDRVTVTNASDGIYTQDPGVLTSLTNSFFYGNGTAVNLTSSGATLIQNCTIANNSNTGIAAFPATITIRNCIIANNFYGVRRQGTLLFNPTITYCDVFGNNTNYAGGFSPSAGCISANPLLASATDPHLTAGSPCIDAADPGVNPGPDYYGQSRPLGPRADIGAVEFNCGTPVIITAQPVAASVPRGQPFAFSVSATGSGLTYQWRRAGNPINNGRGITGATSPTLSVDMAGPYDAGAYDVVVANGCGALTSSPAALTVTAPCGSADFDGDGDLGTDADIEAFFRVLAGGNC